jgi:hypothetical protein
MPIRYIVVIAGAAITLLAWLWVVLLASSRKRVDQCPQCHSCRVRPSWPTIMDGILSISAICAFRCEACLKRFYARKSLREGKHGVGSGASASPQS